MQRIIPITIDIKNGTSDSQIVMYRGDSVKFQFNFINTSNVSLDTATKLRVQVKPANNLEADYTWFAGESTITSEDYSIEFTSSQTAGYSGNGFLAVLVLDANSETVCTAGIPMRVEPSGYEGIFTPSEDFRDDVINARDQAIAAATTASTAAQNCETIKNNCNTLKNQTQSYASQASSNATKAEGYAVGTTDSQDVPSSSPFYHNNAKYYNELCESAKQDCNNAKTVAQQSALDAQTAAETAQSTDAGQLMLSKTPQGFLAFTPLQAWKTQATLAKATKLTSSFSICFTACVGASEWAFYDTADYSALASTWLVQSQASARGFHLAHLKYSNGIRVLRLNVKCRADSTAASHVDLPVSTFSDGKPHAVAFCAAPDSSVSSSGNNGKIRAYVDGVLQASNDAYLAEVPEQNGKLLFMNSLGRVARMCRFNFDISAADAPYTLADYTSGKAIPAELNAPFNFSAGESTWEPMKMSDNTTLAPVTVSVAGDVITITTTAEISEAFFRIKPTTDIIKGVAGQTLHASVESFSGIGSSNGLGVKPMINDGEVGQINLTTNTKSGTWSMDRPFNSVNLTIRYGTSPIPSGTVFTITGLRVWTNGSVVALDDYTFGGKIRDISGNDNHATVSTTNGVRIHGDKDESVQQMYEAFSYQYKQENPTT